MSKFQTDGVKVKDAVDNFFVLRGLTDHSNYLAKELWIAFYDIEKCFNSLYDLKIALMLCGEMKYKMKHFILFTS